MSEHSMPTLADFADAEHCVLEDVTIQQPSLVNALEGGREVARELRKEITIEDRLRKRVTTIRLYEEGWADVETGRRGGDLFSHRIDLRYLDPVPAITQYRPRRLKRAGTILAGIAGAALIPAVIGWYPLYAIGLAGIALIASLTTFFLAFRRSHERIVFRTLHGRAEAIRLTAGLGTIRRFHALLPHIVQSIADAADQIYDETSVYLRAEMREHYRLRNNGVLSLEECARSTERILSKFDDPV